MFCPVCVSPVQITCLCILEIHVNKSILSCLKYAFPGADHSPIYIWNPCKPNTLSCLNYAFPIADHSSVSEIHVNKISFLFPNHSAKYVLFLTCISTCRWILDTKKLCKPIISFCPKPLCQIICPVYDVHFWMQTYSLSQKASMQTKYFVLSQISVC